MSGVRLGCRRNLQKPFFIIGKNIGDSCLANGHRDCFIKDRRLYSVGYFKNLAEPRAHHYRRRRCKPQSAGAGDNKHACEYPERKGNILSRNQPRRRGNNRNSNYHRHKHAGNLVRRF